MMPFKLVAGSFEHSNEGMNWSPCLQKNIPEAAMNGRPLYRKTESRDSNNELELEALVFTKCPSMPFCVLPKSAKGSASAGLKNDPMLHRERLGDESFNIA